MPIIFHQPTSRRSFLKTALFGGAALVVLNPALSAADAGSEFRIALLSDTHVPGDRKNGYRGFNPWENLQAVVPEVSAIKPQAVILNGDAARLEGKPEDYQEVKSLLEPLASVAPIYLSLGNHDDRANFLRVFDKRSGAPAPVDGKCITLVEHPLMRFVLLDSLLYTNKTAGFLGPKQRAWLTSYLPGINDRPVIIFVHHTLGGDEGDMLDADQFFAVLKPHPHVKAVFYGHSHQWKLTERQGLRLVNLPAVGYNFADSEPVGWVDARFRADGVNLTLHARGGNRDQDGKISDLS